MSEEKTDVIQEKDIVKAENNIIRSIDDIRSIADIFHQSGLFRDVQSTAQAFVKIMAGNELGIGAFASMRNVYIIKGNTTLSAGLMASKVKAHPKYNYQIKHLDKKGCIISFFELINDKWEHVGDSSFDESDAQDAGLLNKDNWKCYAKNMYFSRALSNGVRFYCPDIFYGTSVYTPDEIDADWIEGGPIIEEDNLEQKKEQEELPKKKRIKKFTDAQIGAVIQYEKEFENKDLEHNHVVNLLSLSEKIDDKTPENEIIMWVKKYRYEKDTNKADTSLAAEVADNEIFGG